MRNAIAVFATVGVLAVIIGAAVLVLPSNLGSKNNNTLTFSSSSSSSSSTTTLASTNISTISCPNNTISNGETTTSSTAGFSPFGAFYAGQGPYNFAFGPRNGTLYITDENSGSVYATNTTGYPIANITVGQMPRSIIYAPNLGSFFVTTIYSVLEINASTNQVYQNISTNFPISLLYIPSNSELYVGQLNNKTEIFDALNGQLITTISNTVAPLSMAYDTSQNLVYEENYTSTLVLDPSTNNIVAKIPSIWGNTIYDPHNDRIYVANYNDSVFVIYPSTNQEISKFNVFPFITDMTFDSQNDNIYFITSNTGFIGYFSDFNDSVGGLESPLLSTSGYGLDEISYNPTDNLLFATSMLNDKTYVITSSLNGTSNSSTYRFYSSSFTKTTATTSCETSSTQILFFVEVIYNASWSGNYTYHSYLNSSLPIFKSISGNSFENQTVIFYGNYDNGLCVSATVQKLDSSDHTLYLQIFSPTYNSGATNKTSLPKGVVSANFCVSVLSPVS